MNFKDPKLRDGSEEGKAPSLERHVSEPTTPPIRILVVDDSKVNRFLICELLKKLNVPSETAISGREALKKCQTTDYQLIFMDLVMADLDGFETTAEIFKLLKTPPKVYAVTTLEDPGLRKKCQDVGMEDILFKPVDIEQLKYVLEQHPI